MTNTMPPSLVTLMLHHQAAAFFATYETSKRMLAPVLGEDYRTACHGLSAVAAETVRWHHHRLTEPVLML